ncbi:aspartate dehydrogenase [Melghirimyces profundicolus]|uniref:L-aspartate dehydrogenase n=1 Tax=Melghirimyces profundicolus TaxID=1242148 RepID=A0A2T6C8N7_9BACL|nr:aspartate dehydrogenase [Melghirimyces profundicolus]PTX64659.1 aspartate dehydrogenase [Melghirimyces profundicolus]
MLNIGIIGYGAIGKDVAGYIHSGFAGQVNLKSILVRNRNRLGREEDKALFEDHPSRFFDSGLDLVIEAAGHEAVKRYAVDSLTRGIDFLSVSVGAFSDEELHRRAVEAAERFGSRLIFPSAAIGGLDRISAGNIGEIDQVTLSSKKPPQAWYGTPVEKQIDLKRVTKPVCVFEGSARESARLFPENANVSAALSLAGIGFDRTRVRIFVDPDMTRNVHEVYVSGQFGEFRVQLSNAPSKNPKTGYIVAMSIIKALKDLSGPVMIL